MSKQAIVVLYEGATADKDVVEMLAGMLANQCKANINTITVKCFDEDSIAKVMLEYSPKQQEEKPVDLLEAACVRINGDYKDLLDKSTDVNGCFIFGVKLMHDVVTGKYSSDNKSLSLLQSIETIANADKIPNTYVKQYGITNKVQGIIRNVYHQTL